MKHFIFTLIILANCTMLLAQSTESDTHKHRLIEFVNNGDFNKASEEIGQVESWAFDGDDIRDYLDIGHALNFYKYKDSFQINSSVLDSFLIYTTKECDAYFSYYYIKGDYKKTIRYAKMISMIKKSVFGGHHPDYAMSLHNLGCLYYYMGDYSKAETYYLQALKIRKSTLGELHPDYAASLNNLGVLYYDMGDYSKAETYYLQAFEIRKSTLGDLHPDYAASLNNLGTLYHDIGDYSKAETYYLQALEIYKSDLGEQQPDYAPLLNNLGGLYKVMGDYSKAETYYLQALDIKKSVFGEQHPDYATSLNNLGALYLDMGDYSKAETYFFQALEIRKSILGELHLDYAGSLNNIGVLYSEMDDYSKAEAYYLHASQLRKKLFLTSLDFMTEQQRQHYWNTMQTAFAYTYPEFSYLCHDKNPSIATFSYDNELFMKGLLLNSSNAITQSIQSSGDTALINQYNQLKSTKQMILHLQEKEPQSPHLAEYIEQAEAMEKVITKSSAAYRENLRQWSITWDSVRAALKPNQVAIEYMSAPLNEDSTMYCALLLRHNSQQPELIPLFNEKEVASLLHTSTGDTIQINTTYMYGRHGKQLSTMIWGKILPLIKPGETLFCSPTGLLHQIAIENLPYDSTRTIGDVYNFVRLSSTRELVLNKPAIVHQNATLYGDIRYNASPAELAVQHEKYKVQKQQEEITLAKVGRSTDRGFAKDLPGTKAEIEAIQPILESKHIRVQSFSSYAANEESFKGLSGTHQNILHIATHGFFWQDSTAQQEKFFKQRALSMDDPSQPRTIDPLERCGLLFAGANTALAGRSNLLDEGVQDGILTAKEISTMDFRDADIVVLSACETGLGDITGEGVFGLQRAFKMAGAKTILMTLWRVNDDATRMLMSAFYRNYNKGQTKREAFRNAQQEVRNYTVTEEKKVTTYLPTAAQSTSPKEKMQKKTTANTMTTIETVTTQPYQSPYFWAGFILLD